MGCDHLLMMAAALTGTSGSNILTHQDMYFEGLPFFEWLFKDVYVFLDELFVFDVIRERPEVTFARFPEMKALFF